MPKAIRCPQTVPLNRVWINALLRFPAAVSRGKIVSSLTALLVFAVGLAAYAPTLTLNFFWEDPADVGNVEGYSYTQLLFAPNSSSYYRPLTSVVMKLLRGNGPGFVALPYHILNLAAHLAAALLLYGVAWHWFGNRAAAFSAALFFVTYPPGLEAVARVSSPHPLFVAAALAAMWLYSIGRERDRRWPVIAALALACVAVLLNENGVLLPLFVLTLEIFLLLDGRVQKFSPAAFVFLIPSALFVAIWFNIPKLGEPPQFGLQWVGALYLSQALAFPFARLVSQTGGWGLPPDWQAGVALALTLIVFTVWYWKNGWRRLAVASVWWGIASSLIWIARPMEYLAVSPRVMYFPSFAAALAWGGLAAGGGSGKWNGRRVLGGAVVILIAAQSWITLNHSVALYRAGSRLMDQIVDVGKNGGRQLFVNVPDRFEYRQPLYPLGYWGMLLAPVSQDLSDFVRFATGVQMETASLSDFPLLAAMVDSSPYRVNSRGADAHASDLLYDKILWADETYWTDYAPDGAVALKPVGDVRDSRTKAGLIGRFGQTAELLSAAAGWDGRAIQLRLTWASVESARPTDTIFVHLFNADGALVGQGDGDSLNGLLPPSAWRPGNEIEDQRTIIADGLVPPGEYRIAVGLYNRADGSRYPAFTAEGSPAADGGLEAARVSVP